MYKKCHFLGFLTLMFFLCGYGYGVKDPLITGFKAIAGKLAQKDWLGVETEVGKLTSQMASSTTFEGVDFNESFKKAIKNKDRKLLASTWIHLTVAVGRSHSWWNLHENIGDRTKAKARVDAIDRYLKDVLGPQIKSKNVDLYKELSGIIGDMRESLGSPGAFGLGAVKKDEAKFVRLCCAFDQKIWMAYPTCRPTQITKIDEANAKSQLKSAIEKLVLAKGFTARRQALTALIHLLSEGAINDWETTALTLYKTMGTPAHGKKMATEPTASFPEVLNELKKKIK